MATPPTPPAGSEFGAGQFGAEFFGPDASSPAIAPGGLPSAEAEGTPYFQATIGPTGLPSAFVSGTAYFQATVSPGGLGSGGGVGVPLFTGGSITPGGLASGFAAGTPAILGQQIIGPNGLGTAFVSGLPAFHYSQNLFPAGLPTAFAAGTLYISAGVQKLIIPGVGPGLAGIPTFVGGSGGMQLYIANVDRTQYLRVEATNIQSQTIGRANATFDLTVLNAGDFIPVLGQTVIIVDYGNKVFAGCLNSVINELQPYTTTVIYHCQAVDKTSICDHRVINKIYAAGTDAADVVRDIVNLALNGEGITTQGVPPSIAALSSDLNCTFYTVTQAFDAICNDVGGIWWVDFNGVLYFTPLTSLPPCPISLSRYSDNWENLTVENTLVGYANKWYANSNLNVLPGTGNSSGSGPPVVTETYTLPQAAAVARGFYLGGLVLNYATVQILSIKVNGVSQPIHGGFESINFQKSWWYFAGDQYVIPPNIANNNPYYPYPAVISPYPVAGDVVEVSYIPNAQNVAVSAGPALAPAFGTCGSGIYEAVAQVQNVSFQGDLDAIAAKLTQKYSQIPKILKFETMLPGVAVGQLLTVDLPFCDLAATTLFVTSVNGASYGANLGKGSTFKWQVEAATNVDLGNWMKWFERLVGQTENPLPINQVEAPNWVLGPGGSVSAGVVDTNPYEVKRTGKLLAATFVATTPAVDQDMYIDLQTQNGSVFSSPMKIPAGTAAFQKITWTKFFNDPGSVGYPSYMTKGDIFRPPIVTYLPTGPSPTAAANATVSLIWQI